MDGGWWKVEDDRRFSGWSGDAGNEGAVKRDEKRRGGKERNGR